MLSTPRAASAQTDYPALFDATWNAVNEHFYDPSFRGHDWRVIGAQYRAKLGAVADPVALLQSLGGSLEIRFELAAA
jgi:hypothetical protein